MRKGFAGACCPAFGEPRAFEVLLGRVAYHGRAIGNAAEACSMAGQAVDIPGEVEDAALADPTPPTHCGLVF